MDGDDYQAESAAPETSDAELFVQLAAAVLQGGEARKNSKSRTLSRRSEFHDALISGFESESVVKLWMVSADEDTTGSLRLLVCDRARLPFLTSVGNVVFMIGWRG